MIVFSPIKYTTAKHLDLKPKAYARKLCSKELRIISIVVISVIKITLKTLIGTSSVWYVVKEVWKSALHPNNKKKVEKT